MFNDHAPKELDGRECAIFNPMDLMHPLSEFILRYEASKGNIIRDHELMKHIPSVDVMSKRKQTLKGAKNKKFLQDWDLQLTNLGNNTTFFAYSPDQSNSDTPPENQYYRACASMRYCTNALRVIVIHTFFQHF